MRALIATAALFLTAGVLTAEVIEREHHETFAVAPGDRLRLENGDGRVDLRPWDRGVLDVHVVYRADHRGALIGVREPDDFTVDFSRSGETVRVVGREPGRVTMGIGWSSRDLERYVYTVRAPSWLEIDVRGDDGDIEIAGWTGPITIHGEDGDVTLDALAGGDLEVRLDDGDVFIADSRVDSGRITVEDGDVEMRAVEGRLAVESDDGDIDLRDVRSTDLSVSLADGNAYVGLAPVEAPMVDLRSDDGDIVLLLPATLSASFSVDTDDGHLEVDLPQVADLERSRGRVTGRLGGGDGFIEVRTADGDVTLRGE